MRFIGDRNGSRIAENGFRLVEADAVLCLVR
jgi:hypothetical protein